MACRSTYIVESANALDRVVQLVGEANLDSRPSDNRPDLSATEQRILIAMAVAPKNTASLA